MFQINATQLAGAAGFSLAALCAFLAWRRADDDRGLWGAVALVYVLLVIESFLEKRFPLASGFRSLLRAADLYGHRWIWQAGLLAVLSLMLVGALLALRRRYGSAGTVALISTLLTAFVFIMEIVSLHHLDMVLYRQVGPLLLVGWIWAALAAATSFAAVMVLTRPSS